MKTVAQSYNKNSGILPDLGSIERKPYTRVDDCQSEFIHIKGQNPYPNPNYKPDWVSIQLPATIAGCLQKIDLREAYNVNGLSMILNPAVFDAINNFIDEPESYKKRFDKILFQYLHSINSMGMPMDRDQIDFLWSLNDFITSCSEYLSHPAGKEGDHE